MRALGSNSYYRTGSRACQAPGNSAVFTGELFHSRFPCQGGWGLTVHMTCFHVRLMVHPWICNPGALSAHMAVLSHTPEEFARSCGCWNRSSDCRKMPVEKVPGRKSGEGELGRHSDKYTMKGRGRAGLRVDLYFLGLWQQGRERPYGLALTLTSLHALGAAALAVAGFHFLLFLALGVLITGWFNIIIQSFR